MFYYIEAEANSGKQIVRPLVAPAGYFNFQIEECIVNAEEVILNEIRLEEIFPNPANAITCVPVTLTSSTQATLTITDILGRDVQTLFDGKMPAGENKYFIQAHNYEAGTYFVTLKTDNQQQVQKLIVK